jgi:hypothetical protein
MLTRAASLLLLIGLAPAGSDQPARPAPPTWSRDVAPIFFKSCVKCHWPHGVAPLSLLTYDEVAPMASVIRDQVVRREMPPWLVDGPIGEFVNDLRITDREIAIIAAWADAGAPAGAARDLPEAPAFPTWQMGKPDLVLGLPKPFALPTDGNRLLREFSLPLPLAEDQYVERVEVRPGHPFNTHHALVTVKDGGRTQVIGSHLPGGSSPLPAGIVKRIRKGASLTLSMYYDPDLEPVIDGETTVALKFATTPPQQIALTGLSSSREIDLAPNTADIDVRGEPFVFTEDSHILDLTPRMYRRGKQFTYTLVLPDGKERVILKTTRWKDDWQPTYSLTTPIAAPKGSRLVAVGRFDNSSNHEYNPDPKQRVRYPQEVMEGYFEYTVDGQKPPR